VFHAGQEKEIVKNEFFSGIKGVFPILIGVLPFGMIFGVLALGAGIPKGAAQAMSAVVFAGSSQIVMTQLIGGGAPGLVIVLTVAIVNLRHALYSASLAPYVRGLKPAWKWLLAYLLTDEAYVVSILHYEEPYSASPPSGNTERDLTAVEGSLPASHDFRHWYFFGAALALWTTWQLSTAVGIFLGAIIPSSWSLDFTLALTFIALVVPALKNRADLAAALSAGLIAVAAYAWPYKLGLMTAAFVGIFVGMLVESKT